MSRDNLLYSALKELVTIYDFENDPKRLTRTPKDINNAWANAKQALTHYDTIQGEEYTIPELIKRCNALSEEVELANTRARYWKNQFDNYQHKIL